MTPTAVSADFTLEMTSSGWGHLQHKPGGQWASFLEPTDERVRRYVGSHRCGPEGSDWHETADDVQVTETPGATAAWFRLVARYVGTRPPGLLTDAAVWPAVEELAQAIDDVFLAAQPGGDPR